MGRLGLWSVRPGVVRRGVPVARDRGAARAGRGQKGAQYAGPGAGRGPRAGSGAAPLGPPGRPRARSGPGWGSGRAASSRNAAVKPRARRLAWIAGALAALGAASALVLNA